MQLKNDDIKTRQKQKINQLIYKNLFKIKFVF